MHATLLQWLLRLDDSIQHHKSTYVKQAHNTNCRKNFSFEAGNRISIYTFQLNPVVQFLCARDSVIQPRGQIKPQNMIQIVVGHVAFGLRAQMATRNICKVVMDHNLVIVYTIRQVW